MNNDIGIMISTICGLRQISQAELARQSNVSPSYLNRYIRGLSVISELHRTRLETALGVRFDELRPAFNAFVTAVEDGRNLTTGVKKLTDA